MQLTKVKMMSIFITLALIFSMGLTLTGCDIKPSARDTTYKAQQTLMDRAVAAVPVPSINNFLAREAVAKQVKRLDEKGKLFYVYLIGHNGQQIGYYVSNTRPISTCALLTPSEEVRTSQVNNLVLNAPSLGGVYGFGGGCNSHFFFDAATDAYIETAGLPFFTADQPLSLDAEPIRVVKGRGK